MSEVLINKKYDTLFLYSLNKNTLKYLVRVTLESEKLKIKVPILFSLPVIL